MKKLTLLLILVSATLFAQEPITTKLGDFTDVKVFNGLTVELQKSSSPKIEISGSQAEDVSVINADGTLKIRLKFPESFIAEDVKIVLYYVNDIAVLDANEGASIVSSETLKQQHLEVRTQEGAKIKLDIDTKYLSVKSVSGGIISLTGLTETQSVEATTGGIYSGYDLQSKQATVTSASGANVEIKSSELLDANVRFGGSILYKGKPEVLKTKIMIGGTIKDKN
ncbi:MAG: head GIN domain-containing protein [Lutibacter sp.]|nr:head GIN domain-containing protein [Lutibacter sp.]